jgi:hypothetical protein
MQADRANESVGGGPTSGKRDFSVSIRGGWRTLVGAAFAFIALVVLLL